MKIIGNREFIAVGYKKSFRKELEREGTIRKQHEELYDFLRDRYGAKTETEEDKAEKQQILDDLVKSHLEHKTLYAIIPLKEATDEQLLRVIKKHYRKIAKKELQGIEIGKNVSFEQFNNWFEWEYYGHCHDLIPGSIRKIPAEKLLVKTVMGN